MPNTTVTRRFSEVTSRWGIHPALYREITMRAFTPPAVLLTLVLTGCNAAAPTAPSPALASLEASGTDGASFTHQAAPQRPIKGDCEAETVEVVPISPGVIRRTSIGTCQLSHLGRTHCFPLPRPTWSRWPRQESIRTRRPTAICCTPPAPERGL